MPKLVSSPTTGLVFDGMPTPSLKVSHVIPPSHPFWLDDNTWWPGVEEIPVEVPKSKNIWIGSNSIEDIVRLASIPNGSTAYISPAAYYVARAIRRIDSFRLNWIPELFPYTDIVAEPNQIIDLEPSSLEMISSQFYDPAAEDSIVITIGAKHSLISAERAIGRRRLEPIVVCPGYPHIPDISEFIRLLSSCQAVIGMPDQTMMLAATLGTPCAAVHPPIRAWSAIDYLQELLGEKFVDLEVQPKCSFQCNLCTEESCVLLDDDVIINSALDSLGL